MEIITTHHSKSGWRWSNKMDKPLKYEVVLSKFNDGREFHRDYFKSIPSKQMLDMSLSRKINLINKINFGGLKNE